MTLDEIKKTISDGTPVDECIGLLDSYISGHPADDEALLTRGMLHWRLSQRAEAINDLNAAVRLNPRSRAGVMLQSVNTILDFYDKDLYNP